MTLKSLAAAAVAASLVLATGANVLSTPTFAQTADEYVHGYNRSDGTTVSPYYRTAPDGNPYNNYSTQGNTNPYTGQPGTHSPYSGGLGPREFNYQGTFGGAPSQPLGSYGGAPSQPLGGYYGR